MSKVKVLIMQNDPFQSYIYICGHKIKHCAGPSSSRASLRGPKLEGKKTHGGASEEMCFTFLYMFMCLFLLDILFCQSEK